MQPWSHEVRSNARKRQKLNHHPEDRLREVSPPADDGRRNTHSIRRDLDFIVSMIRPSSRVLDVGCGDGTLLDRLQRERQVMARGLEIEQSLVNACVARGLSVIQGNADADLVDYPSNAFDTVILSQTLQTIYRPKEVLQELLRVGESVIVSLPNFGYWKIRAHLAWLGTMPTTSRLPYKWYQTPNIHLCTIRDFVELSAELRASVDQRMAIGSNGKPIKLFTSLPLINIVAEQAIFLLRKQSSNK